MHYSIMVTRGNKTKTFNYTYKWQLDEAYEILTNAGWVVIEIRMTSTAQRYIGL